MRDYAMRFYWVFFFAVSLRLKDEVSAILLERAGNIGPGRGFAALTLSRSSMRGVDACGFRVVLQINLRASPGSWSCAMRAEQVQRSGKCHSAHVGNVVVSVKMYRIKHATCIRQRPHSNCAILFSASVAWHGNEIESVTAPKDNC